ncbi:hypothetical protein Kpol_1036p5 [Vanderwaltozyma polyspora DSM 70294]|uniref:Aminomethyltransferase n=1 Tax=Vanderwaltozyma polyspora (strain ATCC 22028 / DSM 70294 / BCRC 21397 / CBS 2163 / NBRC 10782 / NRRL Y-8283 / UCD 57-17) TaxID=436907 RepID=A7TEF6_VANPO|nr:uncharacterized protein Kpol_1036p5 [Vanderwaltozyma polyspora DSM 70294]EDO19263.1 hypothetical protein Kpol_1036p5 [Vanderwaltozyma polyspora DSM 70294]
MRSIITKRFNSTTALKKTALHDLHVELGAKMVPFAGYSMPLLYDGQTHIESHLWTRSNAGLFDVSHMLQSRLSGKEAMDFLHRVTPTEYKGLQSNNGTLSVLLNSTGGIVDDTMITKINDEEFYIVTNAGCVERDLEFIKEQLETSGYNCSWDVIQGRSLLALQGPEAHKVLQPLLREGQPLKELYFGQRRPFELANNVTIDVARSGYTGEDGFEISVPNENALEFAQQLLDNNITKPIGLAARDSLRLEAGMCLYGNELNESITPVEAALSWLISKPRRNVSEDSIKFNGYEKIMDQVNNKTHDKLRISFKYTGKGPAARTGSKIFLPDKTTEVGVVTSGSASPSLNNLNIGQGYVTKGQHKSGTELLVQVRNKFFPIVLSKSPLVPSHYYRP